MQARYLNPFTDFGFKKHFGEEARKPLLLDFLNTLLVLAYPFTGLQFRASFVRLVNSSTNANSNDNAEQLGNRLVDASHRPC